MNTPNPNIPNSNIPDFSDELISAYLDGELTTEEQAIVERALVENEELQTLFDELSALRSDLQSLPSHTLGKDLSSVILAQAQERLAAQTATEQSAEQSAAQSNDLSPGQQEDESVQPQPATTILPTATESPSWNKAVAFIAAIAAAVLLMISVPARFYLPEEVAVNENPPAVDGANGLDNSAEVAEVADAERKNAVAGQDAFASNAATTAMNAGTTGNVADNDSTHFAVGKDLELAKKFNAELAQQFQLAQDGDLLVVHLKAKDQPELAANRLAATFARNQIDFGEEDRLESNAMAMKESKSFQENARKLAANFSVQIEPQEVSDVELILVEGSQEQLLETIAELSREKQYDVSWMRSKDQASVGQDVLAAVDNLERLSAKEKQANQGRLKRDYQRDDLYLDLAANTPAPQEPAGILPAAEMPLPGGNVGDDFGANDDGANDVAGAPFGNGAGGGDGSSGGRRGMDAEAVIEGGQGGSGPANGANPADDVAPLGEAGDSKANIKKGDLDGITVDDANFDKELEDAAKPQSDFRIEFENRGARYFKSDAKTELDEDAANEVEKLAEFQQLDDEAPVPPPNPSAPAFGTGEQEAGGTRMTGPVVDSVPADVPAEGDLPMASPESGKPESELDVKDAQPAEPKAAVPQHQSGSSKSGFAQPGNVRFGDNKSRSNTQPQSGHQDRSGDVAERSPVRPQSSAYGGDVNRGLSAGGGFGGEGLGGFQAGEDTRSGRAFLIPKYAAKPDETEEAVLADTESRQAMQNISQMLRNRKLSNQVSPDAGVAEELDQAKAEVGEVAKSGKKLRVLIIFDQRTEPAVATEAEAEAAEAEANK